MSPEVTTPRPSATVILARQRASGPEIEFLLIRRTDRASFMSSAWVFPGGAVDPGETDLRVTAARELFEEAGVLLANRSVAAHTRVAWRAALAASERQTQGGARSDVYRAIADAWDLDALHYYAQWITPSQSKKRFSATFFVAILDDDQEAVIDNCEAVDAVWVTPHEALEGNRALYMFPPQVRTFYELQEAGLDGLDALILLADERARHPHAVLPRGASIDNVATMLLPWDPDYATLGRGEALPIPSDHPLAVGPSRFVLEDKSWNHISAPSLQPED